MIKTAMILAAGRGERLQPLTLKQPKALCHIGTRSLIAHHVENLVNNGVEHIVINHAWLGGQIRQHIGDGQHFGVTISYSAEPPGGLETGGGIKQAMPLIGDQPFITVNGDVFTDYPFKQLHLPEGRKLHLVLVEANKQLGHPGDFGLNDQNSIVLTPRQFTFAGIACYDPILFERCPIGRYSVAPLMGGWIGEDKVSGEVYHDMWFDIGSFQRLAAARQAASLS